MPSSPNSAVALRQRHDALRALRDEVVVVPAVVAPHPGTHPRFFHIGYDEERISHQKGFQCVRTDEKLAFNLLMGKCFSARWVCGKAESSLISVEILLVGKV